MLTFTSTACATLKVKARGSNTIHTIAGVNPAENSPSNAAAQVNKIFAIGGLSVVADKNMKLYTVKEAVDDD